MPGGILTAMIFTLALGYFINGLKERVDGSDPTINFNIVHNKYGPEEGLNFKEANQSIAFSVIGANDKGAKFDPRYVKMTALFFYTDETGEDIFEELPLR